MSVIFSPDVFSARFDIEFKGDCSPAGGLNIFLEES